MLLLVFRKVYICNIMSHTNIMQAEENDLVNILSLQKKSFMVVQSPNQKIPDRKTKCVIKTHINIKQNVIFGAKLKPV